jgi:cation diffusion facilitator CzcD-associated flavoprotein CzcO
VSSQGRISIPKKSDIKGLYDTFEGEVVHTAKWRKDLDLQGKRVAVIGNGASGQQIIPNILPQVKHLDHYVRTKTWVTATFSRGLHEATADAPGGPVYTEEEKQTFRSDPQAYLKHRRTFDLRLHNPPGREIIGSDANNELRERIIDTMRQRLGGDEEWLQRVLPDYAPGCKRLTPAPGYLEALQREEVDYVTETIAGVDKKGIITADGKHRAVDIIILATGFELGFTTLFPVIGRDGIDLRDKWSLDGQIGYPETYLGVMAPGYPNYFTVLQVSAAYIRDHCHIQRAYLTKRHSRLKETHAEVPFHCSAR